MLAATEAELAAIGQATARARNRLHGRDKIGLRVGRVIERYRMAKHFELDITGTSFTFTRKQAQIDAEAALDGLYVLRTNVPSEQFSDAQTVLAYKSLAQVERAFRSMKTVDLHVRPIYHFSESRVRAHVFLCMLAYYVEWHLREALKPLLHDDEELAVLRDQRVNPVMPTPRSEGANAKAARHRTDDALPVHSLHTLLQDLATLTYNITSTPVNPQARIVITTRPTSLQSKAFTLLGIDPRLFPIANPFGSKMFQHFNRLARAPESNFGLENSQMPDFPDSGRSVQDKVGDLFGQEGTGHISRCVFHEL